MARIMAGLPQHLRNCIHRLERTINQHKSDGVTARFRSFSRPREFRAREPPSRFDERSRVILAARSALASSGQTFSTGEVHARDRYRSR